MIEVYILIEAERERQLDKWGVQVHDPLKWLTILMEEVGEVAKALLQGSKADVRTELIQVAAVVVTWLRGGSLDD